ncbi:MAG: hypothetical protein RSF73_03070 [Ruthenibacterium sp.]
MNIEICKVCGEPLCSTDTQRVYFADGNKQRVTEDNTLCKRCAARMRGLFTGTVIMIERENLK